MRALLLLTLPLPLFACDPREALRGLPSDLASHVRCTSARECPADIPLCDEGTGLCVPCHEHPAPDQACALAGRGRACARPDARDEDAYAGKGEDGRPYQAGYCVACREVTDCGAGQGCWHGRCVPACQEGRCESEVCQVYPAPGLGLPAEGLCVPAEEIVYVDSGRPCPGAGTREQPYCRLEDALGRLRLAPQGDAATPVTERPALRRVLRVRPGNMPYGRIDLGSGLLAGLRLSLHGDAKAPPMIAPLGQDAVVVGPGVDLTLDGFQLPPAGKSYRGVHCQNGRIALRRSEIAGTLYLAAEIIDCDFELDRSVIKGSPEGALALWGESRYQITRSVLQDNFSVFNPLVHFANGSQGLFRANTLRDNRLRVAPLIACGDIERALEDTSYLDNLLLNNQEPLAGRCVEVSR